MLLSRFIWNSQPHLCRTWYVYRFFGHYWNWNGSFLNTVLWGWLISNCQQLCISPRQIFFRFFSCCTEAFSVRVSFAFRAAVAALTPPCRARISYATYACCKTAPWQCHIKFFKACQYDEIGTATIPTTLLQAICHHPTNPPMPSLNIWWKIKWAFWVPFFSSPLFFKKGLFVRTSTFDILSERSPDETGKWIWRIRMCTKSDCFAQSCWLDDKSIRS